MLTRLSQPVGPRGLGVLVTRPEPGLTETLAAVQKAGWQAYASPALEIVSKILPPLPHFVSALVLTSGQSIPCACRMVGSAVPVFAVGERTAQRARAAGFSQVYSANGNADALLALVVRTYQPAQGQLLLLSGAGQGVALAAHLSTAGFQVTRQVAYAAQPVGQIEPHIISLLMAGDIGHSLFFSAQSAKAWVEVLPQAVVPFAAHSVGLVMSDAAAKVLYHAGWQRVQVAPQPTAAAVLALLGQAPVN